MIYVLQRNLYLRNNDFDYFNQQRFFMFFDNDLEYLFFFINDSYFLSCFYQRFHIKVLTKIFIHVLQRILYFLNNDFHYFDQQRFFVFCNNDLVYIFVFLSFLTTIYKYFSFNV